MFRKPITEGKEVNMTEDVIERRKLWLSWLELPWDVVREDLRAEMQRVGMTHQDLTFELRSLGVRVAVKTVGNWLRDGSHGPTTMDSLQGLVSVFARVNTGAWTKGAFLREDALTDLGIPELADAV
jgi:hypothetical protein